MSDIIDIAIDDINGPNTPADPDPAPGRLPELQAAFLAWETRRLLSTPKIAAARLHIQQTMARRLAEDAELWGPPGEAITW